MQLEARALRQRHERQQAALQAQARARFLHTSGGHGGASASAAAVAAATSSMAMGRTMASGSRKIRHVFALLEPDSIAVVLRLLGTPHSFNNSNFLRPLYHFCSTSKNCAFVLSSLISFVEHTCKKKKT